MSYNNVIEWIIGFFLILSSLGVILVRKPVHASLFFLFTLLNLAIFYLHLSAQFIAVMQVLVYAGAILVIFMFVIILFQDAHQQIAEFKAQSMPFLLVMASLALLIAGGVLGGQLMNLSSIGMGIPKGFGSVESLGHALYIDFFFPFEAVIFVFLIAVIGAFYIGRKKA